MNTLHNEAPPTAYVAGVWDAVLRAAAQIGHGNGRRARNILRYQWGYLAWQVSRGNWRAVRNATVKPYRYESVGSCPHVGWGWTPAGARRDLARRTVKRHG